VIVLVAVLILALIYFLEHIFRGPFE